MDNISNLPNENVTKNRNKYLGGSDIPALFNASDFKDYFTLAKEKAGCLVGSFKGNKYTRYGQLLEPHIRDYINAIYNLKFRENTNTNEELHLRSNCDGLDKDAGLLLEIKTNNGNKKTLEDVFDYILQIHLYFYQFNVNKGYLVQYQRPDDFYKGFDFSTQYTDDYFNLDFEPERISVMEIKRDNKLIQQILDKAKQFWIDVDRLKQNPDMTEDEFYFNGNDLIEYKNAVSKLDKLEVELKRLSDIEKECKTQREILYKLLDKNGVKTINTHHLQITKVNTTTVNTIDSKKFKEDHPDLANKYTKTSKKKGYVRITIRENEPKLTTTNNNENKPNLLKNLGL